MSWTGLFVEYNNNTYLYYLMCWAPELDRIFWNSIINNNKKLFFKAAELRLRGCPSETQQPMMPNGVEFMAKCDNITNSFNRLANKTPMPAEQK